MGPVTARPGLRGRWLSALLATAALCTLLAASAMSLRTSERLGDSIAGVSHTQQVLEQINRLWGQLGDRDSDLLRYLLDGEAANLQRFRRNAADFDASVATLATLVGDDNVHRGHLDRLRALHVERLARNEELIRLKARAGIGPAAEAEFDDALDPARGTGYSQRMRAELDAMAGHERALLADRRATRERMLAENRRTVLVANGLALVAAFAAWRLWRRLRGREEDALRAATEARQAAAAAVERQALVDLLSHDLRQHFGNVQFALGLLRSADDGARPALLDNANSAANSGLVFLDAVLDQAAAEARGDAVRTLRLAAPVEAAIAAQAEAAARRQVAVQARVDPAAAIRVQPAMLHHVLGNLLSNAIRYGPQGGVVEVEVTADGGRVRVCVLDRGPGVSEADRAALFRRFTPLSAVPGDGDSSTGLGLVLARQRVRAAGGELRYEDRAGGGACFVATFPAADAAVA